MDKKRFFLAGLIILLLFLSVPAFYLYKKSAPERIAAKYLKAARVNDLEKLKELSYPIHWSEIAARGVAIRPIDWKFVAEEKVSLRKKEFDLTPSAYKKEVSAALALYREPNVYMLPSESLRNRLLSFEAWRTENINTYGLFEDKGRFYYNDSTPRDELVFDITVEPGKPPVEYMLALERKTSAQGKWEVTEFRKR